MNSQTNPYQAPQSNIELPTVTDWGNNHYMGFWARVAASIIDNLLLIVVTLPLLLAIYGGQYFQGESIVQGFWDALISWVFPVFAIIVFWTYKQATPGKMIFGAKIVDAKTGDKPTLSQWVIRYIGYFPSIIVLFLGLMWIGWDKKKQGWHDKMAGTVVVYGKS